MLLEPMNIILWQYPWIVNFPRHLFLRLENVLLFRVIDMLILAALIFQGVRTQKLTNILTNGT